MNRNRFAVALLFIIPAAVFSACGSDAVPCSPPESARLFDRAENNPLLRGKSLGWDDHNLESPMVIHDGNTYYMYYHAIAWRKGNYRVGLASAPSPSGPWTKHDNKPVLEPGSAGSWDDYSVAIGHVMDIDGTYYMWYLGQQRIDGTENWPWQAGLATAPSPEGPWSKYEGNPVFGLSGADNWEAIGFYVASVQKVGDTYYLWYAGFREGFDVDGQLGLATSPTPQGPWRRCNDNPVITPGPPGSWDGGQINEAAVVYHDGLFHAWYAGYPEKNIMRADIGYTRSSDGIHWVKHPDNPVTTRSCIPGAWDEHRISEPHVLIQGGAIYLYHTGARYTGSDMHESVGLSIGSTDNLAKLE